jgi:hypothetical protein
MDMLTVITEDTGQTEIYIGCNRFIANNQQKVWSPYYRSFRFPMARYLQFLQQQVASRLKQILPNYENRVIPAEIIWFH